jgi:transposase
MEGGNTMVRKGPYKRCDEEFIKETLELIKTSKKPVSAIAKDLGISSSTMYGWLKRYVGEDLKDGAEGFEESMKIRQLKRELEDAKMERDILKKVVAIFSKQPK